MKRVFSLPAYRLLFYESGSKREKSCHIYNGDIAEGQNYGYDGDYLAAYYDT